MIENHCVVCIIFSKWWNFKESFCIVEENAITTTTAAATITTTTTTTTDRIHECKLKDITVLFTEYKWTT